MSSAVETSGHSRYGCIQIPPLRPDLRRDFGRNDRIVVKENRYSAASAPQFCILVFDFSGIVRPEFF